MDLRLGEFGRQKAVPERQFLPIESSANFNSFDLCFLMLLSSLLKELKAISTGAAIEWATSGARPASRVAGSFVSFTCEVSLPVSLVSCTSSAQTSASNYRKLCDIHESRLGFGHCGFNGDQAQGLNLLPYLLLQPRVEKKCAVWVYNPPGFSDETSLVWFGFFHFLLLAPERGN